MRYATRKQIKRWDRNWFLVLSSFILAGNILYAIEYPPALFWQFILSFIFGAFASFLYYMHPDRLFVIEKNEITITYEGQKKAYDEGLRHGQDRERKEN